jgi:IS30 family transposase
MKTYMHLKGYERDRIAVWRSRGLSLREIATKVGRHYSTLSRELRRNKGRKGGYWPHRAQQRAQWRRQNTHKRMRLKSRVLRHEVEEMLVKGWSPELIAGRITEKRKDLGSIGYEAIYQWIYSERPDLIGCLVRAHPKRWPRHYRPYRLYKGIPGRISILERPLAANTRSQAGHWETDLIVGPGSPALQVLVERQTRYSKLRAISNKTASASRAALTGLLTNIPDPLRRSITYDNGSENYEHQVLSDDFGMASYFCQPYHSWEKGTVENTNGLIRRFVPKRTRLGSVAPERFQQIEDWLNDRPRKCLKFQTSREAFNALCCT